MPTGQYFEDTRIVQKGWFERGFLPRVASLITTLVDIQHAYNIARMKTPSLMIPVILG